MTVQTEGGKQYVRNPAHLQKFVDGTVVDKVTDNHSDTQDTDDVLLEDFMPLPREPDPIQTPEPEPPPGCVTRSGRLSRMPYKFKDFVL